MLFKRKRIIVFVCVMLFESLYSMSQIPLVGRSAIAAQAFKMAQYMPEFINFKKTSQVALHKGKNDFLVDQVCQDLKFEVQASSQKIRLNSLRGFLNPTMIALAPKKPTLVEPSNAQEAKELLGITSYRPTEDEIKKAYRLKSLQYHPDKGGTDADFRHITTAKDILLQPNLFSFGFNKPMYYEELVKKVLYAIHNGQANIVNLLIKEIKEKKRHVQAILNQQLLDNIDNLVIVEFLIKIGIDINIKDDSGNTALMLAVMHDKLDCVKCLVQNGADINIQNKDGNTALKWAVQHNKLDALKYLVRNPADFNIQDKNGNTVLMWAVQHNVLDSIKYLVENGANLNIQNKDGNTALMCAVIHNALDSLAYLVRSDADIDIQNKDGNTVLILAVVHKKVDFVQYLLKKGANVDIQNKNGNTALDIALSKEGFGEISILILESKYGLKLKKAFLAGIILVNIYKKYTDKKNNNLDTAISDKCSTDIK